MNTAPGRFSLNYRRTSDHRFFEVFHAHSQMEFTYVHEGNGNLIIEGKSYPIEPNMLMIFQPFQLHRVQVDVTPDLPFVRTVIMFDPVQLASYWSSFPVLESFFTKLLKRMNSSPLYGIRESDLLSDLPKPLSETLSDMSTLEKQEEINFFLLSFIRHLKPLWQRLDFQPSSSARRHSHRAEEIMQWIEEHYSESFKLEQMANDLHLSPYHLAHLFKRATGSTIVEYTKATRIRHASVYLIQSSLTVPEIGARIGISDPSYFCKVFRQQMGSTPHQYRLHIQQRR